MSERAGRFRRYRIIGPLTKKQWQIVGIGFLAAVLCLFVAYAAGRPAVIEMEWSRQLHDAAITTGTIIEMHTSTFGSDGDPADFFITYRLDSFANGPDDPRYIRQSRVTEERYAELQVGETISVRYSPADPTVFLAQETYNNLNSNYVVFACSLCLVGMAVMAVIFGVLSMRFDTRRLFQDTQTNPELFKP